MKQVTHQHEPTYGSLAYEAFFKNEFYDDIEESLPYQFDIENRAESSLDRCVEFGAFLELLVEQQRRLTVRDYIDFFYLKNGEYSHLGVTSRDYQDFVAKVSALDVLF